MEAVHLYLSASLAVIVGATSAWIFTSYLNSLTSKNDTIKDYLFDLQVIETLCQQYWLQADEKKAAHEAVGHELRAKLDATGCYAGLTQDILGKKAKAFQELEVELLMTATGGQFQTSAFNVSPETYGEIVLQINEMRRLLRERRHSLFWAG